MLSLSVNHPVQHMYSRSDCSARVLPLQFIQNHSLPNAGTEYTPQWMNTPNLAWSYHAGNGLASRLIQSGLYRQVADDSAAAHADADIHAVTATAKTTSIARRRFGIFPLDFTMRLLCVALLIILFRTFSRSNDTGQTVKIVVR